MKVIESTKSFFVKCKRVWHSLRKPTKEEFNTVAKISAIGIAALGAMGFLVSIIMKMFA
ncbi:MAG TPA: protein translocase SEC61 complex subunit gamma [Candidatus Nanoarchaeia archaeon]|nr:protein translocase SEC61 complex subunit gamma [Candidatus Nanoarchaeia archaeon]